MSWTWRGISESLWKTMGSVSNPTPLINKSTLDWRLCESGSRLRAESSMSIRGWGKVPESLQGFPPTTSSRRAGPRRRPARESRLFRRLVLETEMCATSERERRQRANRNGEPLDQLHGTSLPASSELSHSLTMWHSLACWTPIWGTSGLTIGVPLMTLKPQMSPTVLAVGA